MEGKVFASLPKSTGAYCIFGKVILTKILENPAGWMYRKRIDRGQLTTTYLVSESLGGETSWDISEILFHTISTQLSHLSSFHLCVIIVHKQRDVSNENLSYISFYIYTVFLQLLLLSTCKHGAPTESVLWRWFLSSENRPWLLLSSDCSLMGKWKRLCVSGAHRG